MTSSFRSSVMTIIAIDWVMTASTQGAELSLMNGKKMNRSLSSQNRIANGVATMYNIFFLEWIVLPATRQFSDIVAYCLANCIVIETRTLLNLY